MTSLIQQFVKQQPPRQGSQRNTNINVEHNYLYMSLPTSDTCLRQTLNIKVLTLSSNSYCNCSNTAVPYCLPSAIDMKNFLSHWVKSMTYYMKSSFELRIIRKLKPIFFFLLEIHIVRLKAFLTGEFRSKYTAPPLKYTMDILWAFFSLIGIAFPLKIVVNKCKLSDFSLENVVH